MRALQFAEQSPKVGILPGCWPLLELRERSRRRCSPIPDYLSDLYDSDARIIEGAGHVLVRATCVGGLASAFGLVRGGLALLQPVGGKCSWP